MHSDSLQQTWTHLDSRQLTWAYLDPLEANIISSLIFVIWSESTVCLSMILNFLVLCSVCLVTLLRVCVFDSSLNLCCRYGSTCYGDPGKASGTRGPGPGDVAPGIGTGGPGPKDPEPRSSGRVRTDTYRYRQASPNGG